MRRSVKIATTTAALVAGGALVASSALAANVGQAAGGRNGNGPQASSSSAQGQGQGQGKGAGQRGMGRNSQQSGTAQRGASHAQNLASVGSGTLTQEQKDALQYMAEEEKLAHDVYTQLAAKYPQATVFSRIADSEQQHLDSVRSLLTRYDLADPTAGKAIGQFASADISALYADLMGSATSVTAAYQVGVTIEKDDLAELDKADDGVTAPDVTLVYSNLTKASERHLAAFERQL